MEKKIVAFLILFLCIGMLPSAFAKEGDSYWKMLGETFSRGFKNIISAPWEIPHTIVIHDSNDDGDPRFFRDARGFFDGTLRTVTRLGGGAFDTVLALIPGLQEGLPALDPETFF